MDVRIKRVGFAALVLAAVLLPLRRSTPRESAGDLGDQRKRSQEIAQQLTRARYRWSALEQRDSALAWIARRPVADPSPQTILSGFPPGAKPMDSETAFLAEIWKRIRPLDSTVRVAILGYRPERYQNRSGWALYAGNLVTQVDGLTWCVAILPGSTRPDGSVQVHRERLSWGLSPCALLAAFGPPGPTLERWLANTRLMAARSLGWSGQSGVFDAEEGPWAWLPDPSAEPSPTEWRISFLRTVAGKELTELRAPPYRFGAPGLRCLTGHKASCTKAVLEPGTRLAREDSLPRDLSRSRYLLEIPGVTLGTPRPVGETFLSDLILEQGRDRFRRFWLSERPLDVAFQEAFGRDLGDWTSDWARKRWLRTFEARYGNPSIIVGVTLRSSWPAIAIGWSALALLGAGFAARRREVN